MVEKYGVCWFILVLCIFIGNASAAPPEIFANDVFQVDAGEVFNVEIYVECNSAVANYTVTVTLESHFSFFEEASDMHISGDSATITYTGLDRETLDFKFPMVADDDTSKGDYDIPYEVHWKGEETGQVDELVESGDVTVSVSEGEQTACSTTEFIILPVLGLTTSFCIIKKRSR